MSDQDGARIYILGPSAGSHAERVRLLRSLSATRLPLYVSEEQGAIYRQSLRHPYLDDAALFGELLYQPDDERVIKGAIARAMREQRAEAPWSWELSLSVLPEGVLDFGPFKVCRDDSLLGAPNTLLLHQGLSCTFRVSPPALTLPTQGELRVVMLERVERDGLERLSVSVLGAAHQLIDGPWWISLSQAGG